MPRPRASPSPPPASFPFTAGNFDYPHASTSPPRSRGDSISRGSQWASYLSRRLDHDSRASAEQEDGMPPRPAAADDGRRRPTYRPSTQYLSRTSASTSTSGTTRPRATPSERYLRRSQARRREQRAADMESTTDILDSLSEIPIANPFALPTSSIRPRSPAGELDGPRRQNKRRKLDHETTGSTDYGFKYGYKGQVVAGRLKMEIVSCDGGEYDKHSTSGGLYKVQNVLKNDKSVYCSESSRCNLLLKHIGEAPFCLEKVVIRAPDRGFTAPVQEGLVFVSMSPDELLSGTSAYQIQYYPHSPIMSPASSSPDEQHLSLREAIEDPYIWQHSRQGAQEDVEDQIERLRLRSRLHMESSERPNRDRQREERREPEIEEEDDEDDVLGEHCDYTNDDVYAGAAGVSAPTPPPFTVTTVTEEEDSDSNEELPSAAIMADRLRRESRWRPTSDDEDDELLHRFPPIRRARPLDSSPRTYGEWRELRERNERYFEPIRATRLGAPSRIEPTESTPEAEGLIAPHARFFIAKNKNKITIKFHPVVSGKYILLKLWSPTHDGNIDIESVQFYGYSGPRFFPATQPR